MKYLERVFVKREEWGYGAIKNGGGRMKKKTNLIELQSSTSIEDNKVKGRGSSDTEEVDVFIQTTQGKR